MTLMFLLQLQNVRKTAYNIALAPLNFPMLRLFRKKKQYPSFDLLFASELKNKYFIRSAEWDLLTEDSIFVFDPNSSGMLTLDQWPQLVFLAAKGQMTVQEYVYYAADKFDSEVPQMLFKTILDQIQTLLEYKIIRLADSKQQLDPLYEVPKSRRDNDR